MTRCKHCHQTLRELALKAMIIDAGGRVSGPSPLDCEHDFVELKGQ